MSDDDRLLNLISEAVRDSAAKDSRIRFIPLSGRYAIAADVLAVVRADGWTLLRHPVVPVEAEGKFGQPETPADDLGVSRQGEKDL